VTNSLPDRRSLLHWRIAVFTFFASFGTLLSTWAVHLPGLQQRTHISTAQLGTVLLVLGVGSILAMQVTGPLIDRLGSRAVAVAGGMAMALLLNVPLAATTFSQAIFGALVFGAAAGAADVAMNAAAVDVEREYRRPIMAAFHAVFSIGTVAGSLLAAAAFSIGASATTQTVTVAGICGTAVLAATFLGRQPRREHSITATDDDRSGPRARTHRQRSVRVFVLGVLTLLLLLAEGSAMDWSSLHAQQHLGASNTLGALAFGAFVTAMTVGRFSVDRIVARVGPVRVVRWGSAAAVLGILIVLLSPALAFTLVGWMLFGLGLAGGVPQVLSAAGNVSGASGRALSRVVGLGYIGILAGPGIIGWVAEVTSLNAAFVVPLGAVIACALTAGVVAAPHQADATRTTA
jgi:predicted MFS family arabinose efflux permease